MAEIDIRATIESTTRKLADWQVGSSRDLEGEEQVALEANQIAHSRDLGGDFILHADVDASQIFKTDYLSRSELAARSDFRDWAKRNNLTDEIKETNLQSVSSYFEGFGRADKLGYEVEHGKRWFMTLGDSTGTYYIPVESVLKMGRMGY